MQKVDEKGTNRPFPMILMSARFDLTGDDDDDSEYT